MAEEESSPVLQMSNREAEEMLTRPLLLNPYENPKALSCQDTSHEDCLVHSPPGRRCGWDFLCCLVCRRQAELPAGGVRDGM